NHYRANDVARAVANSSASDAQKYRVRTRANLAVERGRTSQNLTAQHAHDGQVLLCKHDAVLVPEAETLGQLRARDLTCFDRAIVREDGARRLVHSLDSTVRVKEHHGISHLLEHHVEVARLNFELAASGFGLAQELVATPVRLDVLRNIA